MVNGLGMFLSCSGINAIHTEVAGAQAVSKPIASTVHSVTIQLAKFTFLPQPINWWQSQEEYIKLKKVDSLELEISILRGMQIDRNGGVDSLDAGNGDEGTLKKRILQLEDSLFKCIVSERSHRLVSATVGARKMASVSATKMNVLYVGVDNPLRISVSGVPQSKISASIAEWGKIVFNADGTYTARVSKTGKYYINIFESSNGKIKLIDSVEFRSKIIPDPIPTVGGVLRGGNCQAGALQEQKGIVAICERFDFEANFKVVSFQMVHSSKGEIFKSESQGALFNKQMLAFIANARSKDIIFIDEIKVVGPDKIPRKLGQITFRII